MADNFIVEKDGKKYVYRSTSVYDQQTHRKRTVSEYVGRIDPETGELIEKKSRAKAGGHNHGVRVKSFGPSYALSALAESCGLREDLRKAFGADGDKLLAMSISLMLSGGPLCTVEPEMDSNMSRELLGIGDSVDSEQIHRDVIQLCNMADSVETLFKLRSRRASRVAVFSHVYMPSVRTEGGWVGHGSNVTSEANYCIATDLDGVPVFFEPCYEINLSLVELRKMVDRIIGFGVYEPIVILDQVSGNADNLEVLTKTYISFTVPARKKTPAVKQMLSQVVKKRTDPRSIRHYCDDNFIVYDSEVTVVPRKVLKRPEFPDEDNETTELELVSASDPRFQHVPLDERIIAWACLEIGDHSDDGRESMQNQLSRIEARLMDMDPYEAVDRLMDVAGDYSRFFDLSVVEGELDIKIRQKAVTAALNREGIFVLLSHGIRNWNGVMQCYSCRNMYNSSLNVLRNILTAGSEVKPTLMSTMMTQFVSLVLWTVADKRIRDSGLEMSVSTAMQHLSPLMATGDGVNWHITEVTPRIRRILEALGVRIPDDENEITTDGDDSLIRTV